MNDKENDNNNNNIHVYFARVTPGRTGECFFNEFVRITALQTFVFFSQSLQFLFFFKKKNENQFIFLHLFKRDKKKS